MTTTRRGRSVRIATWILSLLAAASAGYAQSSYVNFESSQVRPIARTPSGSHVLAVNTPNAMLEVFAVQPDGGLIRERVVPVGLEPVTVAARTDTEAWVVNHLSDSISIVDLSTGSILDTVETGDEPTDVVFAAGKAFVAVSQEDQVEVFDLADLAAAPSEIDLFGSDTRALAVSNDGATVYAVVLHSGNGTTVVHRNTIPANNPRTVASRLQDLGLEDLTCDSTPPPYPPNPAGITTNPALTDPPPGGTPPELSLIVKWNPSVQRYEDDAGQDWTDCLPYRLPDHDLFAIDAASLAVSTVSSLGTTLFEVSVHPQNGKVYVPHTEARNEVRFEHPLGVQGHIVDNRVAIVDPGNGNAVTQVELNAHIDRGSDPATNLAERSASISQPGHMVWEADGSHAWLTAIGSRKLFRLDGACLTANCIFGADRAAPDVVDVGEGPTGVALDEVRDRLYVLNRFDNEIAIVDRTALAVVDRLPMYDPSDPDVVAGRRFLYDAILGSGHGDAACSSCHISGDMDRLGWDLGNPEGDLVPYGQPGDNVRFIAPADQGSTCPAELCASHEGFDPRKGPMTTQTLRGMLEPLHWRGDRPTMAAFNGAFPLLMGTEDVSGPGEPPKGLSDEDMETFRRFALGIRFPPNPFRNLDDTLPNADVPIPGHPVVGNPTEGQVVFNLPNIDGPASCSTCHSSVFGSAGGKLGGLDGTETDPEAKAGLVAGELIVTFHNDMKVAHLRNMYEKFGPVFGTYQSPPDRKDGFGFGHDGSVPDLGTFFSGEPFQMTAEQVRDVTTFVLHWPTSQKPTVGHQVTVPPGAEPTGTPDEEARIDTLLALGDSADADRHCDLTASALEAGTLSTWKYAGGLWVPADSGQVSSTTAALRTGVDGPITFTCGTIGSGDRLGTDWDEDGVLNADDCAPANAEVSGVVSVSGLVPDDADKDRLRWIDADPAATYNVFSGAIGELVTLGLDGMTCLDSGLTQSTYLDLRADPPAGDGYYYLVQAENECGAGPLGPGRESVVPPACP